MNKCWPEDERMCETSEESETLFTKNEIGFLTRGLAERIRAAFGFQDVSQIAFDLKVDTPQVRAVLDGTALPSCELLLRIRKVTNASLDWLLTGEGLEHASAQEFRVRPTARAFPVPRRSAEDPRRQAA